MLNSLCDLYIFSPSTESVKKAKGPRKEYIVIKKISFYIVTGHSFNGIENLNNGNYIIPIYGPQIINIII